MDKRLRKFRVVTLGIKSTDLFVFREIPRWCFPLLVQLMPEVFYRSDSEEQGILER